MCVQTSKVGRRAGSLLSAVIRRLCVVRSEGDPAYSRHQVTCLKSHWHNCLAQRFDLGREWLVRKRGHNNGCLIGMAGLRKESIRNFLEMLMMGQD